MLPLTKKKMKVAIALFVSFFAFSTLGTIEQIPYGIQFASILFAIFSCIGFAAMAVVFVLAYLEVNEN